MGTNIHMHIEHKSKKTHKFVYDFEHWGDRIYDLYGALAGTRGTIDPIYEPRDLPEDISREVKEGYKLWEGYAHTPSWLTTKELRECMDLVLRNTEPDKMEMMKKWMSDYEWVYEFMRYNEDDGEPSRIVFWFDN